MKESDFQKRVIAKIKNRIPDSFIIKNDPTYKQGIPDLLILYKNKWAMLECKQNSKSKFRPNQQYYLNKLNNMSFASSINIENEEDVLNDMERAFDIKR